MMATSGDGRLLYVAEAYTLVQEMDELQVASPHIFLSVASCTDGTIGPSEPGG